MGARSKKRRRADGSIASGKAAPAAERLSIGINPNKLVELRDDPRFAEVFAGLDEQDAG